MQSIFSIDVEDWFNIPGVASEPPITQWDSLPSCVEKDFNHFLDICSEHEVHVTCFFLGYFGHRFPNLVRRAVAEGHEIASHGYHHQLVFKIGEKAFFEDVLRARLTLEEIAGEAVRGYRAPAFSVTAQTPWFFSRLVEAGYTYDSSVFPASHTLGGLQTSQYHPHVIDTDHGRLIEFPVTAVKLFGKPMCVFGGGYLRLSPYALTRWLSQRALRENRPVVFYVHPREINPSHPRLPMGARRTFQSYVNLRTTEPKVRAVFREFELTTFRQFIASRPDLAVGR